MKTLKDSLNESLNEENPDVEILYDLDAEKFDDIFINNFDTAGLDNTILPNIDYVYNLVKQYVIKSGKKWILCRIIPEYIYDTLREKSLFPQPNKNITFLQYKNYKI